MKLKPTNVKILIINFRTLINIHHQINNKTSLIIFQQKIVFSHL